MAISRVEVRATRGWGLAPDEESQLGLGVAFPLLVGRP